MADDFRPHLLITEDDVEHVEYVPQARGKDRGLDRFEHGSKLSSGLQDVVSAYTRIQSGDSLKDEDIRLFEVVLPDDTKFSNKAIRDFLAQEGMSITSIRDAHHAIVSTSTSKFDNLQKRVGNFRDNKKVDRTFQDVAAFKFPDPADKQSSVLKALIEKMGQEPIDVEIREELLVDQIGVDGQARAEQNLISTIRQYNGEIVGEPYKLSDETPILRAKVPLDKLTAVSEDTIVCHVALTGFYGTVQAGLMPAPHTVSLDPTVNIDELPIVAVLDTGVDFPDALEPIVVEHWTPSGAAEGDKYHGTNVASKIAFAQLGAQMGMGTMVPRARIIDCNIRGADPNSDDPNLISNQTMIKRIREAVLRYKDITKIFNFSSASRYPIAQDEISILGYELDVLSITYGVKFVIAVGNHDLYEYESSLEKIFDDDDSHVAAPSDSMLNISVGAIVGSDHTGSISKQYDVAPYSRIGPGFKGSRKPDIVTYAGTKLKGGSVPPDEYSLMIGAGNQWALDAGTSFSAPVVAGDLAEILTSVPDDNVLLAEALLYHRAVMPIKTDKKDKPDKGDNEFYGNLYGRGISSPIDSMFSTMNRVTFLHAGTMNRLDKQRVKFLMPKVCDNLDMSKRNAKVKITVTCVTQSPVDNNKGEEYLGAYVNASLHIINGKGTSGSKNPSETDGRKEWDTCFHFEQTLSSLSSGDWEVWLQLHTRYDVKDDQEIEYALAITIEDLTDSLNLYEEIVNEAQNRFPAVQLVRLPVRL